MPPVDPPASDFDDFEVSPMPPMAPDGGPAFAAEPRPTTDAPPISRCSLGPCVHLHEIRLAIDAQEPLDGSSGSIYTRPKRFCYPSAGVELELAGAAVRECSKWRPTTPQDNRNLELIRNQYASSGAGKSAIADFDRSWKGDGHAG